MSSIEVEIPPGVLMTTSRASAWSASARLTAFSMYAAMIVLMSPTRSARSTWGVAAAAWTGDRRTRPKSTIPNVSAKRFRMPPSMATLGAPRHVKRGTLARWGSLGTVWARRKIGCVGVSRNSEEHAPRPRLVDSDAETMRDLMRQVDGTRPLGQGEQTQLLERAALGDRA